MQGGSNGPLSWRTLAAPVARPGRTDFLWRGCGQGKPQALPYGADAGVIDLRQRLAETPDLPPLTALMRREIEHCFIVALVRMGETPSRCRSHQRLPGAIGSGLVHNL